ncbi:phosphoenolpyruvate carboxykinase (ATP) [Acidobacteria bacterium AH-259-D05]|nr:phosphoenolpyruvate carboxykinase (ATP) [Acidobacteria bacterium AH-259-D05]
MEDKNLLEIGIQDLAEVHRNLLPSELVEHSLRNEEAILAHSGALRVTTGKNTGRSPNDKFTVEDPEFADEIWWGEVNRPFSPEAFERLREKAVNHLRNRTVYIFDGFAGADPRYRLPIRVINELAWHNLFAHQLFVRPSEEELKSHEPDFTVLAVPNLKADPQEDGTHSDVFILVSLARRLVIIGGSHYAGEMKKSIFSVMNYLMPQRDVLPMHCSANIGAQGDVALFFGLSGTGKTTLSADPKRRLIGDDEHGWSDSGVFNFEGGCYAKCINLTKEKETQIWEAIRFGSVIENVTFKGQTRVVDYESAELTENTRVAYPVEFIPGAVIPGVGGHPSTVIFLTADAFGVLPPISRLSRSQAMYHFISGYTSKVAGTEKGITEPQTTFSPCFGAPFLPLHPQRYAEMLGQRIEKHNANVYLVNTGWTGGAYGQGHRIELEYTRAMITAALSGALTEIDFQPHPVFQVEMPKHCPDVPSEILDPKNTWEDKDAYDRNSQELARCFAENSERYSHVSEEILSAGPQG